MEGTAPRASTALGRRPAARAALALGGAAFLLAASVVLAAGNGTLSIPPSVTLSAIVRGLTGSAGHLGGLEAIVWNLRLPRVVMGALVGASLAASGAAMQGLFRNPLADPYLMGVASGAAFGVTVALAGGGGLAAAFAVGNAAGSASGLVPVFAFLGALGAVFTTLWLSRAASSRSSDTSLVLSGVVVGSVLIALSTYLMLRDADRMRAAFAWTLGNLSLAGWAEVGRVLPYAAVGFAVLWGLARALDALQLGEDTARTLGIPVERVRLAVVVASSLATAAAVAYVGTIGFVGLVAPHVMRRLAGPAHRTLVPASALAGAALLVLADLGARTLTRPAELPVGVVTTLLGGPFFLWLLRRRA